MSERKNHHHLNFDEQRELELLEKTKNEGFVDEEAITKNKKAGAPIAPLGGSHAYYLDHSDPHPPFEEVLPLQFQPAGKVFWYHYPPLPTLSGDHQIQEGDHLVAYSERGVEIAEVLKKSISDYNSQNKVDFIKHGVIRKATPEDMKKDENLRKKALEAQKICEQHNRDLGINMKLRKVKYTLDESKVIFYFTAPGRVDFRELIKRLASSLHRRIEMRQIGVRDTTKMLGGIGPCGQELCCRRYLHNFVPVSVKMAKDQNLSLNPNKISGCCGRLFCCLGYEDPLYTELRRELPLEESEIFEAAPSGRRGFVKKVNVLNGTISVVFPSTEKENYEERLIQKSQLRREDRRWEIIPPAPSLKVESLAESRPPQQSRPAASTPAGEDRPRRDDRPRRNDRDERPRNDRPRDNHPRDNNRPPAPASSGDQKDRPAPTADRPGGEQPQRQGDHRSRRGGRNRHRPRPAGGGDRPAQQQQQQQQPPRQADDKN